MHPEGWTIALQAVNFAVLAWLLHRFLYKPVLAVIDARKAEVARQFDDAKAAEDQAKAHLAQIDAQRAAIAAERDALLKSAAAQAQEAAEARRSEAEREAQALADSKRKTLEAERMQALEEARTVALDLGAGFARRFLAEIPMALRAEAWLEQIEHRIGALGTDERAALIHRLGPGTPLTVVTAEALPADAMAAWRDRLGRLLGDGIGVAFLVDADLVAGAELHFPTAILRFSWQNALADLRSQVNAHADAR